MSDDKLRETALRVADRLEGEATAIRRFKPTELDRTTATIMERQAGELRAALADSATLEGVPDSAPPGLWGMEESRDSASPTTADAPPSTNPGEPTEEMWEDLTAIEWVVSSVVGAPKGSIGSPRNTYLAQIDVKHGKEAYAAAARLRAAFAATQPDTAPKVTADERAIHHKAPDVIRLEKYYD